MSIHPVMQRLADKLKRTDLPEFVPGDQIRVQVKIKEGDKERLQAFEGLVIAINRGAAGHLYRAQDELWPGRGAHLPVQLQGDRQD
jgi:ribosomal protein L19